MEYYKPRIGRPTVLSTKMVAYGATGVLMAFRAHAGELIQASCLRVVKNLHMCNEYWICASDCLN